MKSELLHLIQKDFTPYPEALELKELGFDEPCFGWWFADAKMLIIEKSKKSTSENIVQAPTFSQSFRWFRDKHKLSGIPTHHSFEIWDLKTEECIVEVYPISSFEEAELTCLRKLIEIVKTMKDKFDRAIEDLKKEAMAKAYKPKGVDLNMKQEYIIINKTAIQKRIEELEKHLQDEPNPFLNTSYQTELDTLKQILSQSTPAPELEQIWNAAKEIELVGNPPFDNMVPKYKTLEDYISKKKVVPLP
jgi:hypothetical protein